MFQGNAVSAPVYLDILATRSDRHVTRLENDSPEADVESVLALDILDGKNPPRRLNPEVWPVYRERFGRILGRLPQA